MNTIKSATKEPKVSKLPGPKPVPCALTKTSKNVTVSASNLKRSQIAHPGNFIDFLFIYLFFTLENFEMSLSKISAALKFFNMVLLSLKISK